MSFTFLAITRDFVSANSRDFIEIARRNISGEYWNENNFLSELQKKWEYSFMVTADEGKMVGFLIASEKEQSVHIHKFVVDLPFQGKGLGTLMLDNILKQAGGKPVTLKVQKSNPQALAFYRKKGFVINGSQNDLDTMIYPRTLL